MLVGAGVDFLQARIYLFMILGVCVIGALGFVAFTFVERDMLRSGAKNTDKPAIFP